MVNDIEKNKQALELMACLHGVAVEVVGNFTSTQRASYSCVTKALQQKFGGGKKKKINKIK